VSVEELAATVREGLTALQSEAYRGSTPTDSYPSPLRKKDAAIAALAELLSRLQQAEAARDEALRARGMRVTPDGTETEATHQYLRQKCRADAAEARAQQAEQERDEVKAELRQAYGFRPDDEWMTALTKAKARLVVLEAALRDTEPLIAQVRKSIAEWWYETTPMEDLWQALKAYDPECSDPPARAALGTDGSE
jgi:hypothetical protein